MASTAGPSFEPLPPQAWDDDFQDGQNDVCHDVPDVPDRAGGVPDPVPVVDLPDRPVVPLM